MGGPSPRLTAAERSDVAATLAAGGFVAAEEEADELVVRAGGDDALLSELVRRRLTGEPLAWITGTTRFCGEELRVQPGVYVPRWHSEPLALRAAQRLPEAGCAVDLCTGSGAIACVLMRQSPGARVVGTDLDPRAVACARVNGVDAIEGDLYEALPAELRGAVDVVSAVVPYVPAPELELLQRDTFAFETVLPYDGGPDGTTVLRRVVAGAPAFLRPGGVLLVELGEGQPALLEDALAHHGFGEAALIVDEDRQVRGLEATFVSSP